MVRTYTIPVFLPVCVIRQEDKNLDSQTLYIFHLARYSSQFCVFVTHAQQKEAL